MANSDTEPIGGARGETIAPPKQDAMGDGQRTFYVIIDEAHSARAPESGQLNAWGNTHGVRRASLPSSIKVLDSATPEGEHAARILRDRGALLFAILASSYDEARREAGEMQLVIERAISSSPTTITVPLEFDPSAYEALVRLATDANITTGEALQDALQFATDVAEAQANGWRILLEKRGQIRVLRGARKGLLRTLLGA